MSGSVDADWNAEGTVLVACRGKSLRFSVDNGVSYTNCAVVETGAPSSEYEFVRVCHNGLATTAGRFLAVARNETATDPIHTYSFISTDGQTFNYTGCINGTGDTTGEGGTMHPAYDSFGTIELDSYNRVFGLKSNRQETGNRWVMCTASAGLFTTDDGTTWTRRTLPNFEPPLFDYYPHVFDVFYDAESQTWLACGGGTFGEDDELYYSDPEVLTGVAKSLDNGVTWTAVVGNIRALGLQVSPISSSVNADYWYWEWAFVGRQGGTWFVIDANGAGIRSADLTTWEPFYELNLPSDNDGNSGLYDPATTSDYYSYFQRAMRDQRCGFNLPARTGIYYRTQNGVDWQQFFLSLGDVEPFAWFLANNWLNHVNRKYLALSITGQRQSLGTPEACGTPASVTLINPIP